ncbi:MAG: TIGR02996 domain-containing protein [Gemmataceae bacterium]
MLNHRSIFLRQNEVAPRLTGIMTEKEAFLADIVEHPDEDAPRLVFADWLEDHDEAEFAEFIRVQCALAREKPNHPRRAAWLARETELHGHAVAWLGRTFERCDRIFFRRGFVESIHIRTEFLLEHCATLFDRHPIRMLRLLWLGAEQLSALASLPQLQRLAVLIAPGSFRHAGCEQLLHSPHLHRLRGLALNDTPIGVRGLQMLLDSPSLTGLTHLHLGASRIGEDGIQMLASSSNCQRLVALDVRGNRLGINAIRALDHSPYLTNLRRLGWWYNRLGDEGLAEFLDLPLFTQLEHLSLGNNHITRIGLERLAATPALVGLRTLWLGVDRYDAVGILALVHSKHLHPQARIGVWLTEPIAEEVKTEARARLGDRISFDMPGEAWDGDPTVSWPLWQTTR